MKTVTIYGPPGTGKTRNLVGIAEREATEREANVLYLAYTRAAAQEATSRIDSQRIEASTIHSLAFRSLNMTRSALVDAKKLVEFGKTTGLPFKGSEPGSDEIQEGDEYVNALAFANNRMIEPDEAYEILGRPGTPVRFRNFVTAYLNWKRTYGFVDFDDMLKLFINQGVARTNAEVLVLDESQDCSPLQWAVFKVLCKTAKRVYIAGDDDQAIYEWNGSDPHGMAEFSDEMNAEVRILDQSYRVPQSALKMATERALTPMTRRVAKEFKPRKEKGQITRYGDVHNLDLEEFHEDGIGALVLARDRYRQDEIRRELNREMVPYDVLGGLSPWTSKTAQALKNGANIDVPLQWRSFYRKAAQHPDWRKPPVLLLSTIHQAKGREHSRVVIDLELSGKALLGINLMPDSELRVLYVALTRTSNELHLCGSNPLL